MAKKINPAAIDEEYQRVALVVNEWWQRSGEAALADLTRQLVKFAREVAKEAVAKEAERRGRSRR